MPMNFTFKTYWQCMRLRCSRIKSNITVKMPMPEREVRTKKVAGTNPEARRKRLVHATGHDSFRGD